MIPFEIPIDILFDNVKRELNKLNPTIGEKTFLIQQFPEGATATKGVKLHVEYRSLGWYLTSIEEYTP